MKRIILAISISLTLFGCDQSKGTETPPHSPEDKDSVAISFSQSLELNGRAIINDSKLSNADISLYGHSNAEGGGLGVLDVFNHQTLNADNQGVLSYSPIKYFDLSGQKSYSFFAHYPLSGNNGVGVPTFTDGALEVAVDCAEQQDVVWATTSVAPIPGGDGQGNIFGDGIVALNFKHTLSQIKVMIVLKGETLPQPVVKSASINAITTGVLNIGNGSLVTSPNAAPEDFDIFRHSNSNISATAITISNTPQQLGDIIMLPVQIISSMKIILDGASVEGGIDVTRIVPVTGLTLEQGKATTITITINSTTINFTQTVTPWIEGGTPGSGNIDL